MNTGVGDSFNLAWKLALVCRGQSAAELLDTYETERRPVAERVVASGNAVELALGVIDAAERKVRNQSIRTLLTDVASTHVEAIAEAELDVDYRDSPIVTGAHNPALAPGQRLPDTITVIGPETGPRMLHDFGPADHSVLLIGGPDCDHESLAMLSGRSRP